VSAADPVVGLSEGPYHWECSRLRYEDIKQGKPKKLKGAGKRPTKNGEAVPTLSQPRQYFIPGL
jgi:hypothetical protein